MDHNILNSPVPEFPVRSLDVGRPVFRSLSAGRLALRSSSVGWPAARSFSVGGVSALSRLPRGEARGKEPRGEALAEAEKSHSQAEKIVILIANPGIRTGRNSLKTKETDKF